MKKILFLSLLGITVLTTPVAVVNAEEEITTTVEEEVTSETLVEEATTETETDTPEKVSFMNQLNDFCNKWMMPILAFFDSLGGVALGVLLFYKKMKKKIEDHEAITDEDVNEAKSLYTEGKEVLVSNAELLGKNADELKASCKEFKEDAEVLVNEYKAMAESQGKKLDKTTAELSTLKALICHLVASEPSLALNGYAKQIMELCDESDEVTEEGSEGNE